MNLNKYNYSHLSVTEQVLYRKIHDAIKRQDEYILCGEKESQEDILYKVLQAVAYDHPEFFHVHPHRINIEHTSWGLDKIRPDYFYDKKEKKFIEEEIKRRAEIILEDALTESMDEGEIIKGIHDALITGNLIEDRNEEDRPGHVSITGALLENRTGSLGISLTLKYLLQLQDIESAVVGGNICTEDGSSRQNWNLVKLYGMSRFVDVCEDARRSNQENISYDFFVVDADLISDNHKICDAIDYRVLLEEERNEINYPASTSFSIEAFDSQGDWDLENAVLILENLPQNVLQTEMKQLLDLILSELHQVLDLEKQYPNEKDMLHFFVKEYLPTQMNIIKEYCRYKNFGSSKVIVDLIYGKMLRLLDEFEKGLTRTIDAFWKNKAGDMLTAMGVAQEELLKEKKKRMPCPFTLSDLENQKDINIFIKAYEYFATYEISKEFTEQISLILEELNRMKLTIEKYEEKADDIYQFLNYYILESIKLVLKYDEYQMSGISDELLEDIGKKVVFSLISVKTSLHSKLDEIYRFEAMKTKAEAAALADLLAQDGYY